MFKRIALITGLAFALGIVIGLTSVGGTGVPGAYAAPLLSAEGCNPNPDHTALLASWPAPCTGNTWWTYVPYAALENALPCGSGIYALRVEVEICDYDERFPPRFGYTNSEGQEVWVPIPPSGVVQTECLDPWPQAPFKIRSGLFGFSTIGDRSYYAVCCDCPPPPPQVFEEQQCATYSRSYTAWWEPCPSETTSWNLFVPDCPLECNPAVARMILDIFTCEPISTVPFATVGGQPVPLHPACEGGVPCEQWTWESACVPFDQLEFDASVQLAEGDLEMVIFQHTCCGGSEPSAKCDPSYMYVGADLVCDDQQHSVLLHADPECELACPQADGISNLVEVFLCAPISEAPTFSGYYRSGAPISGIMERGCTGTEPCHYWFFLSSGCEPEPIAVADITAGGAIDSAYLSAECCQHEECGPEGISRTEIYPCGSHETATIDLAPCPAMECASIENAVYVVPCDEWDAPPTGWARTRSGAVVPLTFFNLWGYWVYWEFQCHPASEAFTSVTVTAPPNEYIQRFEVYVECCDPITVK